MNPPNKVNFCCDICGKIFVIKRYLLQHRRKVHNIRISKPLYECNECQHLYSKKIDLIQHIKTHQINQGNFCCDVCGKIFVIKRYLLQHRRKVHNIRINKPLYECNKCQYRCSKKIDLIQHISKTHQVNQGNFCCDICGKMFVVKRYLSSHRRRMHNICIDRRRPLYECNKCQYQCSKKKDLICHIRTHEHCTTSTRIICPECNKSIRHYSDLRKHITNVHNIELRTEKFTFKTEEDFTKWKSTVEERELSSYVLNCGAKRIQDGSVLRYYVCHRSYEDRSKIIKERKRRLKYSASNKIGKACPAGFSVKKFVDGKIVVKACHTHVGHTKTLKKIFSTEEDQELIAGKLPEGVEIERIQGDIRNSATVNHLKWIHLLERKDIHNIKQHLDVTARRHEDDFTSVDLWVECMNVKYGTNSPVLFYKKRGEEYNNLRPDDFMIVIATEFQLEMLQFFGNKIICIDGTFGLNSYRYQLFSVIVIDEYSNGIPVSYCFSNRNDTDVMEIFFGVLKVRLNQTLSTEILMSDDNPVIINAWTNTMESPEKHLLCTWYVNKNWLEHLNSIRHPEKRELVRDTLYQLRCENSEACFKMYLKNFVNDLLKDEDTKEFGIYFRTYYAPPHRCVKWAYIFQNHTEINCNTYLESLHKNIKHCYLKGTKCRRLDKAIDTLMTLTRDKIFDRIIKLAKGNISAKIIRIDESHKKSLTVKPEDIICDEDDPNVFRWFVKSSSCSIWYTVEFINLHCPERMCDQYCKLCNICIHNLKCSCPDNTIYFNLCKHIHAVKLCQGSIIQINENNYVSEESILQETVQFLPVENDEDKMSKRKIQVLLENMLGLIAVQNLEEEQYKLLERQLRTCYNTIINGDKNKSARKKFKIKDKINNQKNVSPQKRFVSCKKP